MGYGSTFNSRGQYVDNSLITGIIGTQNTIYGGNDDPTKDMGVFVGVGQENASGASIQNGSQGPINGTGTATRIAQHLVELPASHERTGHFPIWHSAILLRAGTLIARRGFTFALGPMSAH